jgi:UDP:flavonoid glycosyltransferase YjiC (YdhE family)
VWYLPNWIPALAIAAALSMRRTEGDVIVYGRYRNALGRKGFEEETTVMINLDYPNMRIVSLYNTFCSVSAINLSLEDLHLLENAPKHRNAK